MDRVIERIKIAHFFSINEFEWEIKPFNVLTGGMATGKSLCLKLVYFVEQILLKKMFFSVISRDILEKDAFYNSMTEQFYNLFHSDDYEKDFSRTKILYTFEVAENHMIFDLKAEWNEHTKKLEWRSKYIDTHIAIWQSALGEKNTPDAARNARQQIHESISHDFLGNFPIATMFIPASRAIAAITDSPDIPDPFLSSFIKDDKLFVLEFNDVSDARANKILHLNDIVIEQDPNTKRKTLSFISTGGRKISPLELSSGQQELIFLLLLIKDLPRTTFFFGKSVSIFIEEPSAHLFPREQKESMEYFVRVFRTLRDEDKTGTRFFITTHSPYILNVINNMLKKGGIINRNREQIERINEEIEFPALFMNELSAGFINDDGTVTDMLDHVEELMFADKIDQISFAINDDTNRLDNLNNALIQSGETKP
jgi:hypothetical protein